MEIFFITLAVIFVPVLVFLIYLPINGERYSAAAESYPNACQDYSEATNPPTLETESFESGRSHLSPCLNTCQDCSEVPKPPPVTDPCIPDYYCRYYCHYDDHHYRTKDWTDRKAPKPPPVTDPCIVYYYYYCYSYYYGYHYANDRQTHSKVKNTPFFSTPESSRHRTSRSSAYSNACQDYGEVPKPPPVTDPHIVDYYYNYYCHYYDLHYPTIGQPDSEAPKPPLVTDPCIVYYYYYYYSYYFHYHKASRTSRSRHPRHKKKAACVFQSYPEPGAPCSFSFNSCSILACLSAKNATNEHRSSQGFYLEISLHDELGI
ncbi:hypothetical protein IFM60648_08466 [Aspergillus lentulus]|uniref:Uncharacterized protein n=1 Tax=Aspergillus lentulus TaxID=293939 RepID=A0ABQ1AV80_ASPLE|nr:hypothetical protein IFM62136_06897 [Aspergillus lentulus]GFF88670.1 hypothetical protein IFM60648_08466 [Aspergillus lentulus]